MHEFLLNKYVVLSTFELFARVHLVVINNVEIVFKLFDI
jgi:hypothetical protein